MGDTTTDGGNLCHIDDVCYVVESELKGTYPTDRGALGGARGTDCGHVSTAGGS